MSGIRALPLITFSCPAPVLNSDAKLLQISAQGPILLGVRAGNRRSSRTVRIPSLTHKEKAGKMKKQIGKFVGVAILLTAAAASGQISQKVRATVPFSFMAGDKVSPAGDYRVEIDRGRAILTLSSDKFTIFMLTTSSYQPRDNRNYLRFNRYGDKWFLQAVSFDGTAQITPMSKREKEMIASKPTGGGLIADIAIH